MLQNRIIIAIVLSPFLLGTAVSAQQQTLISGDYTNNDGKISTTIDYWDPTNSSGIHYKYYYVKQNLELDGSYTFDVPGTSTSAPEGELFIGITAGAGKEHSDISMTVTKDFTIKHGTVHVGHNGDLDKPAQGKLEVSGKTTIEEGASLKIGTLGVTYGGHHSASGTFIANEMINNGLFGNDEDANDQIKADITINNFQNNGTVDFKDEVRGTIDQATLSGGTFHQNEKTTSGLDRSLFRTTAN